MPSSQTLRATRARRPTHCPLGLILPPSCLSLTHSLKNQDVQGECQPNWGPLTGNFFPPSCPAPSNPGKTRPGPAREGDWIRSSPVPPLSSHSGMTPCPCPQERVVERNRMWVATGRRGWCLEVPLFPLHPNLRLPSSRPFLKRRGLGAYPRHTSTAPALLGRVIFTIPLPGFLPRGGEEPPRLAAPELMSPAAQLKVWLTPPLPKNWPEELVGPPLSPGKETQ